MSVNELSVTLLFKVRDETSQTIFDWKLLHLALKFITAIQPHLMEKCEKVTVLQGKLQNTSWILRQPVCAAQTVRRTCTELTRIARWRALWERDEIRSWASWGEVCTDEAENTTEARPSEENTFLTAGGGNKLARLLQVKRDILFLGWLRNTCPGITDENEPFG